MGLPFAFSFACWKCAECRRVVEWCDAIIDEEDGRLLAVRHKDCA